MLLGDARVTRSSRGMLNKGARLRMGMVHRQNEALTSKLALGVCAEGERIWGTACSDTKRVEMEDPMCFMLIAFGAGLRGEEVPLVSLEGLLNFWTNTRTGTAEERYMMMTLSGRFKGEFDSRWHIVPISDQTHSNIPFQLWMEKIMVQRANHQHWTKGWLFETRTGARAKFRKYDATFRSLVALARAKNSRLNWRTSASGGPPGGEQSSRPPTGALTPM